MKKGKVVCYFVCAISVFFCLSGLLTSCSKSDSDSAALHRTQTMDQVKDLNGQSTRMDEGTLQAPDGHRGVDGLDGKRVRGDKGSGHDAEAEGVDGLRVR
ncbi:MAG: hypothetical protein KAV83_06475 [Desulfobacterales bacterium]|nr:hypothetical protein [Desulfobacterales bacterium]